MLAIINRAIINNVLDSEGRGCVRFLDQGLKLLGRITSQVTNDGLVWEKYAELTEFQGQSKAEGVDESCIKSCQFLQRACSSISQKSGWEKDVERCKDVHRLGIKYAQGNYVE